MECAAHKLIPLLSGPQSVPVPEAEANVPDPDHVRLLQGDYPHRLEIVIGPYVVIPLEEVYLDSGGNKVLKRSKYLDIALRNDIFIFVPEIPDIPQKIQRFRFSGGNSAEHTDKPGLAVSGIANLKP